MSNPEPSPPRWAESLLRSLLRPSDRESITGDLLEEYRAARHPALGTVRAHAWYVKHVLSVLWPLIWPFALPIVGLVPLLGLSPASRHWNYSLVPAPAISLLHCMVYAWAGYHASRRTGLIRTGSLAAAVTSLVGFTAYFVFAAISLPGLLAAPFSKPFIFVILLVLLLIALGHGVVIGTIGGIVGTWHSRRRTPAEARSIRVS